MNDQVLNLAATGAASPVYGSVTPWLRSGLDDLEELEDLEVPAIERGETTYTGLLERGGERGVEDALAAQLESAQQLERAMGGPWPGDDAVRVRRIPECFRDQER